MFQTRLLPALLLICACTAVGAQQMWEWMQDDGNGPRRVISDRPPPANLKNIKILRQPRGAVAAPTAAAQGVAPPPAAGNLPALPTEDKDLVARKKQAEAAEAEKQRMEKVAESQVRADNCARAQTARATMESGQRLATIRPDGERVVLDDEGRAAEMRRIQGLIQQSCN